MGDSEPQNVADSASAEKKVKRVPGRVRAAARALKAKRKMLKGKYEKKGRKFRSTIRFRQPRVLELRRKPKCPSKAITRRNKMDHFAVIKYPLATESTMKKIEDHNTLVFIVDNFANKIMIKAAVKKLYDVEVEKVNTLIRPDGLKKAYVRLKVDHDALDIANKIDHVHFELDDQ
ncbi:hypothetical protein GJ496_003873 [Pomphorhynchus laevis]|nr:hypothetical protein GJ496_003873 [Pomphorhynchus laevis]